MFSQAVAIIMIAGGEIHRHLNLGKGFRGQLVLDLSSTTRHVPGVNDELRWRGQVADGFNDLRQVAERVVAEGDPVPVLS